MTWLDEMKRDAVALVDPDLVLTEHMDVTVSMSYDDGYDPTFTSHDPSFSIEILVFDNESRRYLIYVSYTDTEAEHFWLDLMKAAAK